jgi:uncharacterized membrane protein
MTCSHCFTEMPDISAFCPGCGRQVRARIPPSAASGRQQALAGALAYVLAVPAIFLLALPVFKSSRFVRFHCWQSLLFLVASALLALAVRLLFVVLSLFAWVGFLLAWLCAGIAALGVLVIWAVLVTKAALGETYELPGIGAVAERLAGGPKAALS